MKNIYKQLLNLCVGLTISSAGFAQSYSEGFDDITLLAGNGWSMQNLSSPIGTQTNWFQGTAASPFVPYSGAGYIGANYDMVSGTGTMSAWLLTPTTTFSNGDVITFYTRTTTPGSTVYPDRLEVRLSTNGASTNVGSTSSSVGDFTNLLLQVNPSLTTTGYPSTWTPYTINMSGLPGPLSGRLAFRYSMPNAGPTGTNGDYIGIDNFSYASASATAPDVEINGNVYEYTMVPLNQVAPISFSLTVTNTGSANTSDATATVKVWDVANMSAPVYTQTSSATSINNAANASFNLGSYTPTTVTDYYVEYISNCTGNTIDEDDTMDYFFSVTDDVYARDNGNVASTVGIGAGPTGYMGTMYTITATTALDSVLFALTKPGSDGFAVSDSTRIAVYNVSGGVPTTIIGTSPAYLFTASDTAVLKTHVLPVHASGGGQLVLSPGTYFVSVVEYATNIGLCFTSAVFTPNTVYVGWTGQPFTPVENFGAAFAKSPVIRPLFNTCIASSSSQTLTICAGDTVTVGTNMHYTSGIYTDILVNAGGCDSTVTTNLTVNPASTSSQTLSICNGSSVTVGANIYTMSGNYSDTLVNMLGCDSIVTTNLTVDAAIDVTTNVNAETITANATGAAYQWLDCDNGNAAISGEMNQSFTAASNGNYAVAVTVGSCTDTSSCVSINSVGLKNSGKISGISVYPNPGSGLFTIKGLSGESAIMVYDATGKTIQHFDNTGTTAAINIVNNNEGMYLVRITNSNGASFVLKLIKQ